MSLLFGRRTCIWLSLLVIITAVFLLEGEMILVINFASLLPCKLQRKVTRIGDFPGVARAPLSKGTTGLHSK